MRLEREREKESDEAKTMKRKQKDEPANNPMDSSSEYTSHTDHVKMFGRGRGRGRGDPPSMGMLMQERGATSLLAVKRKNM